MHSLFMGEIAHDAVWADLPSLCKRVSCAQGEHSDRNRNRVEWLRIVHTSVGLFLINGPPDQSFPLGHVFLGHVFETTAAEMR